MSKRLLFAVVLLLIMMLPTATIAGEWISAEVTFTGDIAVKEGSVILDIWGNKKKSIIEWMPINLTYEVVIIDSEGTDLTSLSENWQDMYDEYLPIWNETYDRWFNYFGKLDVRKDKRSDAATIIYRFGRITEGKHSGRFKYHLEGTGVWSTADGTITSNPDFTIYELSWIGNKRVKATYEWRWEGLLTFTIEIDEV